MWSTNPDPSAKRPRIHTQLLAVTSLLAAVGTAACGGEGATRHDGGVGLDAAVTGPDVVIGTFSLEMEAPRPATALDTARAGSSGLVGTVGDKPAPNRIVFEIARKVGDCTLFTPRHPFCDPSCGREVCVEDDTCEADRVLQDVGTLVLGGITTTEGAHEITLVSVRNTYQNGAVEMPYPAFQALDLVTLTSTGGPTAPFNAPFTVGVQGIETLQVPETDHELLPDTPLALTWTAPTTAGSSQIRIKLDISHHGGSKGHIECVVEDNGSTTIDAELITDLLALGVAGFPSVLIQREATGTTQLAAGKVALTLFEYAERWIVIDGLVSCTDSTQCEAPQVCLPNKSCG